ncbi:ankyrin repeat domain-containing protein 37 isoform X3 [Motacilla alba alba]|uniref:ankyrin repeat domain-containing protein 37 isoform X3 n=1 Tax=Motacilla alba alba TaxID=1094192 RepID=UPI0018D59C77|nr:ankyrin repeat domain-containing protein 37 isoform X3 [Motacilla alba alba]
MMQACLGLAFPNHVKVRWQNNCGGCSWQQQHRAHAGPRSGLGGSRLTAAAGLPAAPAPARCSGRCRAARGSRGRCRGCRVCAGRAGRPRATWPPPAPRPGPDPAAAPRSLRGGHWAAAAAAYVRPAGGAGLRARRSQPAREPGTDRPAPRSPSPEPRQPRAQRGEAMLMLDCSSESGSFSNLFETGTGVNAPADASGQSPAHLAACGGEAFFLLWQLQTGANLNQQDCLGEAPIHKAAKVGSLECLALLVAGDAKVDLCNNSGQTAADLALDYGFLECAKFLRTIQHTQTMKLRGQSGYSLSDRHGLQRENPTAEKQESETSRSINRKRRRSDDLVS